MAEKRFEYRYATEDELEEMKQREFTGWMFTYHHDIIRRYHFSSEVYASGPSHQIIEIHDASFSEFLFTWREKRQDTVLEPFVQEEHLDTCWATTLFRGRILPSVNESLREEPIDIDVTVLDSDVLDRLAKDL
ncbi:hypothetical protein YC2023_048995 [Brassica napus]